MLTGAKRWSREFYQLFASQRDSMHVWPFIYDDYCSCAKMVMHSVDNTSSMQGYNSPSLPKLLINYGKRESKLLVLAKSLWFVYLHLVT